MIIEINERVKKEDAFTAQNVEQSAPRGGPPATGETEDKAAALYHLRDLCDEGDTMQVITPPHPVPLGKFTVPGAAAQPPAYTGVVSFTTPKRQQHPGRIPVAVDGAAAGSSAAGPQTSTHTCHYLLVRLAPQETDLLVFVNVPHEEFDLSGDPRGLSREEEIATALVAKLAETLEVRDWGLFGSS